MFSSQQINRFKALEYLIYWEGGVNAVRLSRLFNIQSHVISKTISLYRENHPGYLVYDAKDPEKIFVPTEKFVPTYILPKWSDYVAFLHSGQNEYLAQTYNFDSFETALVHIQVPEPTIVRLVLKSIRTKRSIKVVYRSRNNPKGKERVIEPHAIANDGLRWHCRAYCHTRKSFGDFNIGRIVSAQLGNKRTVDIQQDNSWFQFVDIKVAPHPELPVEEQQLLLNDYGYSDPFTISTRGALVDYTLQFYRIAKCANQSDPHTYPLVVMNTGELEAFFFRREQ